MSKWATQIPVIKEMAGKASTEEIANAIGTTVPNLHKICHRNNISLPRDPASFTGGRTRKITESQIQYSIELLVEAGYRVIPPDPFRQVSRAS